MSVGRTVGGAATGVGVGAAFGGPVGAGIGGVIGGLGGALGLFGGDSDEKALIAKQKQLAAEAQRRREELQRSHMRSLNQQMMAAGPRNQVMAQMFGPEAAFSGKQMADMTANPMGAPQAPEGEIGNLVKWADEKGMTDQQIRDWNKGSNPSSAKQGNAANAREEAVIAHREKVRAYEREEAARRAQMEAAFGTPQGPAPIAPTQAAPARRF